MTAKVTAVNISAKKGQKKAPVEDVLLRENYGIVGDAHSGDWHRQVSLLAEESIERMRMLGLDVCPGSFAENITTRGIELISLEVGTKINLDDAQLEVTQIGKECHKRCEIYHQAGDCVMPKEGIFARVLRGGQVQSGSIIQTINGTETAPC